MEADVGNDIITSLRSDLAGLQYKRDKLISEVRTKKIFYWFIYQTIFYCI